MPTGTTWSRGLDVNKDWYLLLDSASPLHSHAEYLASLPLMFFGGFFGHGVFSFCRGACHKLVGGCRYSQINAHGALNSYRDCHVTEKGRYESSRRRQWGNGDRPKD